MVWVNELRMCYVELGASEVVFNCKSVSFVEFSSITRDELVLSLILVLLSIHSYHHIPK